MQPRTLEEAKREAYRRFCMEELERQLSIAYREPMLPTVIVINATRLVYDDAWVDEDVYYFQMGLPAALSAKLIAARIPSALLRYLDDRDLKLIPDITLPELQAILSLPERFRKCFIRCPECREADLEPNGFGCITCRACGHSEC